MQGAVPISDVRGAVRFIRKYMAGEEAEYKGWKARSEWIRKPVPIYMAAEGPKMLQLAGEVADGVISIGANPEWVKWKMAQVEKGALRAGRDPSEIEYWMRTMLYVTDSRDEARSEVSPYPIAYGNLHKFLERNTPESHDLRMRLERAQPGVAEELITDSKKVGSAFAPYAIERLDAPWVKYVTWQLIDHFHLVGKPDDINERIFKLGS